jgi:cob(I)alamin adenosyltransferase
MSIATRKGDTGETDLLFGSRCPKSHPRVHALGAVDELNASLGPLRVTATRAETRQIVPQVQRWLIGLMGELATPPGHEDRYHETHSQPIDDSHVGWIDEWVAKLEAGGAMKFEGWALPGEAGSITGAYSDLARTMCRRAERFVIDLDGTDDHVPNRDIIRFINRLSDLLWLLARWEEKTATSE